MNLLSREVRFYESPKKKRQALECEQNRHFLGGENKREFQNSIAMKCHFTNSLQKL